MKKDNNGFNKITIFVPFNKLSFTSNFKKMKKIAYLFVAFAFCGVVALSSCKSKTEPAPADQTVIEETTPQVDTAAVDTTAAPVQ
jgi:hypothetical protein